MVAKNFNDGELLSLEEIKILENKGYVINRDRDFTTVLSSETDSSNDKNYRLNFVGFTTNKEGEMKTVFPKKYEWGEEIDIDRRKTFRTITKHIQKNPSMYIGSEFKKNIDTNYPFSAFFSIYEYYERYGIHFEEQHRLKAYGSGKVNWKETIRLSQKFIVDNKLVMLPIYHNEKRRTDTFLANCMIYAIDYTIDKFSAFIEKEKTNRPNTEFDFLSHREFVLENLHSIRNTTYSDIHINLIDNLIEYFSVFKSNGEFYLKHYSYANVWEEMVMEYLNSYFAGFENDKMNLSSVELTPRKKFYKPRFNPNIANINQSFEPDHYLAEDDTQIILDAKYYEPTGMDYKQISYLLFLKNKRDKTLPLSEDPIFTKTHSALIIPSDERDSREHFKMDPYFNKECEDIIISEERLNIKEVIDFWISN